ncbi:uncharacterized protein AAG666_006038 [Megaptera novaeangliae]
MSIGCRCGHAESPIGQAVSVEGPPCAHSPAGFKARAEAVWALGGGWTEGTWDLSSPTKDQTRTPCTGRRSLNHWTTREVPPPGNVWRMWYTKMRINQETGRRDPGNRIFNRDDLSSRECLAEGCTSQRWSL